MELSALTHIPFETFAGYDSKLIATYVEVVREIERKRSGK